MQKKSKNYMNLAVKRRRKISGLVIAVVVVFVFVVISGFTVGLTFLQSKLAKTNIMKIDRDSLNIDDNISENLKDYRNILILGVDARDMKNDKGSRTDGILIASINKETDDIKLVSVARDTYLEQGKRGLDKITHAYAYDGPVGTLSTMNKNFDLNIEEFIVFNWNSVATAIDSMGGIDIVVKKDEVRDFNKAVGETASEIGKSSKGLKINGSGRKHFNGIQATTYCRIRETSGGDIRRGERTRLVMNTCFNKAKSMKVASLNKIANKTLPLIKTNMDTSDMINMIFDIMSFSVKGSISFPKDQKGATIGGVSYQIPVDLESNVQYLHEELFNEKNYEVTNEVKRISDKIAMKAGR